MSETTLFNTARQEKIMALIRAEGSVNVNRLSELFSVSAATIRSDLTRLEAGGEITRTHGGAILANAHRREPRINERFNEDKKRAIAEKAVELVSDGDTLLLDTGTTMLAFARALARSPIRSLTVYTSDIDVIRVLEEKENFDLHLFAGKMRNGFHYVCGPEMIASLKNCYFDKLFLATSAVSLTGGLTTANPDLAAVKREMLKRAQTVILLTDSTKLGHVDFQKFADIQDADILITDKNIAPEDEQALKSRTGKLLLV